MFILYEKLHQNTADHLCGGVHFSRKCFKYKHLWMSQLKMPGHTFTKIQENCLLR